MRKTILVTFTICLFIMVCQAKEKQILIRFDFGAGKTEKGWTPVTGTTLYSEEKGFGLIPSG